jgi:hypothetical protein
MDSKTKTLNNTKVIQGSTNATTFVQILYFKIIFSQFVNLGCDSELYL